MFNDYSEIASQAKYKVKYEKGFKILTLQQMLQKITNSTFQLKANNTSEDLLNKFAESYVLCIEKK